MVCKRTGENVKEDGEEYMVTKTLGELNTELGIQTFPDDICPKDSTVWKYYKELNKGEDNQCKCSPLPPPPPLVLQLQCSLVLSQGLVISLLTCTTPS